MTYRILDIETTIHSSFKRKANPFDTRNWIVAVGTQGFQQAPEAIYFHERTAADNSHWLANMLDPAAHRPVTILVGHNIKFDLLHAIQDPVNYEAFRQYIIRGGTIWDTQTAEYLLGGMAPEVQMISLDELAPQYGGHLKESEVKRFWEAGIDTPEIPKNLLLKYLIGGEDDALGDIGNTRLIFLGQCKRAKQSGQMASIKLNMMAQVFIIEAEFRGMFVDKARGLELAQELEADLGVTLAELETFLPRDLPFKFNMASRTQLSAWIFGGQVRYDSPAYTWDDHPPVFIDEYNPEVHPPIRYSQTDELHYIDLDAGLVPVDVWDAWRAENPDAIDTREFFKSGKNAGQPKTKKVKVDNLEKPKTRREDRYFTFPGFTKPDPEWKTNTEGVYSTGSEVIEILGNRNIPFTKTLAKYTAILKDLGTYFITTDEEGNQKGMLTLVGPDGIIHHSLNNVSTVTARLSSSNPNLQNIPKGNKSKVKTVFVSRFGEWEQVGDEPLLRWHPTGKIVQSDFSSLEVYIQAILTKCKNLIQDLLEGKDMHCVRLSVKEKMPYEEVFRLCKIEVDAEWDYKRTGAKVFSFQRAYGAGKKKIADSTGMSEDEVQALIDAENERYPEIEQYYEALAEALNKTAQSAMPPLYQQHPDFPKVTIELKKGEFKAPSGKSYSYRQHPAPKFVVEREAKFASFSPTEIKNYIVQGEGAEWAKAAMAIAVHLFYRLNNFNGLAFLVNQVHDAIYLDAHESVAFEAAAALHACMESASPLMEILYGYKLPLYVPTDTVYGNSMAEEDKLWSDDEGKQKFKARVAHYKSLCGDIIQSFKF